MIKKIFIILFFTTVFVFPLIVLVFYTFAPGWTYPDLFPRRLNNSGIEYVVYQGGKIARALATSFIYSLLTVVFAFLISLFPASVFARYDFKFKKFLESLALAPALVPAITFSVGIHYFFIKAGLADTLIGVVIVLSIFSYPYMLRSLISGFLAFSTEYEICASNLGAGIFMRLYKVELPLLLPSIVAGSTVVFLVAFSEYFLVFLIGGGTVNSYTGYLFPFLNSSDRSIASVLTLFFMVIPIFLFLLIDVTVTRVYRRRGMV
jgi:ABC-type spermidine/putrescine transport system permease subunit II